MSQERGQELPHLTQDGDVHMVRVSEKSDTVRRAVAEGRLVARADVVDLVRQQAAPKGDVLASARIAAIMAVKKTWEWIPLAHPLSISGVSCDIAVQEDGFYVSVSVETVGKTGVEMEALTGVSAALLTLYDMLKARDRSMTMGDIRLVCKSGGRSGDFRRGEGDQV